MFEEPALIALTSPVEVLTVATALFEELHVPPAIVELIEVVSPTQMACVPLRVPATGGLETVSGLENTTAGHPPAAGKV
jgi:hypothetical protein